MGPWSAGAEQKVSGLCPEAMGEAACRSRVLAAARREGGADWPRTVQSMCPTAALAVPGFLDLGVVIYLFSPSKTSKQKQDSGAGPE